MHRAATLSLLALVGCAEVADDPREAAIVSALTAADQPLLRARGALATGRYARMAAAPYDFYRGAVALFLRDWRDGTMSLSRTRFGLDWPQPFGLGDPHPENFGTLLGADGALRLEANDLDAADRVPYLWDLRRLTVGLCLAARLAHPADADARARTVAAAPELARRAAESYATAIAEAAQGRAPAPVTDGRGSALLDDLFRRARRDAERRAELAAITELRDGRRSLRRGATDAENPQNVLVALPEIARSEIPSALQRYRESLTSAPEPRFFDVLDAARELGSGVASWPRVRVLALVRGPSDAPDDDVVLELKEEADPIVPGAFPPAVWWDSVTQRILAARGLWSRPAADPLWGAGAWLGFAVQVRSEREAHKTVRVDRMTGAQGDVASLTALAVTLGAYLAGAHAARLPDGSSAATAIAGVIARDPAGFAREQAEVSDVYARRTLDDWQIFRRALASRGPTLGLRVDANDAPSSDLRALLATDRVPADGGTP
jgi:uncharacterized protein (DUF2252 family)